MKNKKDNAELLCSIGELSGLFTDSDSLEQFLQGIVELIAEHMHSQVCSIYLYQQDTHELVLQATKGLNPDFIGNIRLKLGEGVTGLAIKELRPINERNVSKNPSFKYFPGSGEEKYESFLAVPILRGTMIIGAMVVQNEVRDYFNDNDIRVLSAITSQLANTIEMTRLIMDLQQDDHPVEDSQNDESLKFIKGKVGSSGIAYAKCHVIKANQSLSVTHDGHAKTNLTKDDFQKAVDESEQQLEELQQQIEEKLSDVASLIFSAQILMLKDKGFVDAIVSQIDQGVDVVESVTRVVNIYIRRFESLQNEYLKEKAHDVRDIGQRIIHNLLGSEDRSLEYEGKIVIAQELFPSDALKLASQKVKGIIILTGGVTSHLSLLARSLQIPLIIAQEQRLLKISNGADVLIDADVGNIYINPEEDILTTYNEKQKALDDIAKSARNIKDKTQTKDNHELSLMANINLLGDVQLANDFKANGIGLYRTEFPFIVRSDFPSEEEQYIVYKKLVDMMPDKEITFRTLDIGGDKVLSYFHQHAKENNPFLGMRSIRFSLEHKDVFSEQIRAILRAGYKAKIRMMFPMISSVDEFLQAKEIVNACKAQLKKEKTPFANELSIGIMIELPSVIEIIDDLAKVVDFFSIGTNDFIQYMLAIDRTNERVADLYLPHHPSVLRSLKKVVDAAKNQDIDVSVCGDMAQEDSYLPYFLGIGLRKFSVSPNSIFHLQQKLESLSVKESEVKALMLLNQSRIDKIEELLNDNEK